MTEVFSIVAWILHNLQVVWILLRFGNPEIYYKKNEVMDTLTSNFMIAETPESPLVLAS